MEPTTNNKTASTNFVEKGAIELASAGTSVAAYHPFRTIALQIATKSSVTWSPFKLYRGFSFGLMGAHQLFVMGAINRFLIDHYTKEGKKLSKFEQLAIGLFSGAASTLTVTPFEMMGVQKQLGKTDLKWTTRKYFRGIAPMAMRQMGLGPCMFVLPQIFRETTSKRMPIFCENHPEAHKLASGFFGGVVGAIITHVPEIARQVMQADFNAQQFPTVKSAFHEAARQMRTSRGVTTLGIRLGVLALATTVMTTAREQYSKWFDRRRAA